MQGSHVITIRVDAQLVAKVERARKAMEHRQPGLKASQADAVRAMIEAGAAEVIGDIGG